MNSVIMSLRNALLRVIIADAVVIYITTLDGLT